MHKKKNKTLLIIIKTISEKVLLLIYMERINEMRNYASELNKKDRNVY